MDKKYRWTVELYERSDGTSPIKEFIEDQLPKDQVIIFAELDDLAEFGTMPRGNKLKHLGGKLWELRFRGSTKRNFRFVYFAYTGRKFVVLHCFVKKTRRTPQKELHIARQRLQDYLESH